MQNAYGTISLTITTATVLNTIANQEGKDFSKHIGNVSNAIALAINKVDNNT